ncbi:unnamed protein product [Brachionus calyciflorus]|uniref:VWFA domain-containing protein n=1 Tax=Brachionus calyciflorus TaxID=104777 RepID=A0A814G1Y1_9BILA|nr:unnamed protein product [Brachionus calyciflorus]
MTSINQQKSSKRHTSVLDLAFIMDCTGSMGSYIENVRKSINEIVDEIVKLEKIDIRLSLVEYRDNPPQETSFETRVHDFTESTNKMREWLDNCSAVGGGDQPECVAEGLNEALKLNWRGNATKICVLICDAPPHGINCPGDTFPNGSPNGIDPIEVVNKLAQKSITLYTIGCEPALLPFKEFFSSLAYKTGGQYIPLSNAKSLAKVIVGGVLEDISLEKLMSDVQEEIEKMRKSGVTDEKILAKAVESRLKEKGVTTKQILLNDSTLEKASDTTIKYSKLISLVKFRDVFEPKTTEYSTPEKKPRLMGSTGGPLTETPSMAIIESIEPSSNTAITSRNAVETYSIDTREISYAQSERLVQKVLNRSKISEPLNMQVENDTNEEKYSIYFDNYDEDYLKFLSQLSTDKHKVEILESMDCYIKFLSEKIGEKEKLKRKNEELQEKHGVKQTVI